MRDFQTVLSALLVSSAVLAAACDGGVVTETTNSSGANSGPAGSGGGSANGSGGSGGSGSGGSGGVYYVPCTFGHTTGACEHVGETCRWGDTSCTGEYFCAADHTWQAGETNCTEPTWNCNESEPCQEGMFCDYAQNLCGAEGDGTCVASPRACSEEEEPTCGCDGVVYSNGCVAQQAGVDHSNGGGCEAPATTFACGPSFCLVGYDYCQRAVSDTGDPDSYSCIALPAGCGVPADCACLETEPCGFACEHPMDQPAPTLTCPGG